MIALKIIGLIIAVIILLQFVGIRTVTNSDEL